MKLTPKQQRFVDEYLIDLNLTQAAIRAGYSRKTAHVIGQENIKKPAVAEAIAARQQSLQQQTGITRDRVLRELAAIGMSDIRRLYDENGNLRPIHELDADTAASIAGIETDEIYGPNTDQGREVIGQTRKVKRFDKTRALELLGRHLGLWQENKPPENVGPGLTVIVQQAVQVGEGPAAKGRVVVSLPAPESA
jgi:phage terminase small subunit